MSHCRVLFSSFVLLLFVSFPACGVIFYSTGDPAYNTNAPSGALTNSGWQYTGRWGAFLGTVLAPRYFVTAKHIGTPETQPGSPFFFQGRSYTAMTSYEDPNSDLRIWRICGSFPPPYAPLYTNGLEVNKGIIIIGRGTQRGAEVRAGLANGLKGWNWGANDSVQRWGSNTVSGLFNGGTGIGLLLTFRFNAGAGPDEAQLSYGDSGGPIFLKDVNTWKLAGLNYAADGYYSTNGAEPGFFAAVFDKSDLHELVNQVWVPGTPTAGTSYATRIADINRLAWIDSIVKQSPPPDPPPVLQSAATANGAYTDDPAAVVNVSNHTITVPVSSPRRFFRLSACTPYRISNISVNGPNAILAYE